MTTALSENATFMGANGHLTSLQALNSKDSSCQWRLGNARERPGTQTGVLVLVAQNRGLLCDELRYSMLALCFLWCFDACNHKFWGQITWDNITTPRISS